MKARENIADILCIGCQKGSTSWLHSVLSKHPKTWVFEDRDPITSTNKEAHFWDWNRLRGIEWYRSLMTPPDPGRVSMDFTPEYAILHEEQVAECKALNPSAKVIYILRDPLARAISALRMYILWHLGSGYAEALPRGHVFDTLLADARLDLHGDYSRTLALWRRYYPDMIVLNYEDFHTDRRASVLRIMQDLSLPVDSLKGPAAAEFDAMLQQRVWVSEPFKLSREVVMTLHGMTWQTRREIQKEHGLHFVEGTRILEAAGD